MKFSHAGSLGDAVYSTLFMTELSEGLGHKIEAIHLQYGKKGGYCQKHPYGDLQLTKRSS